MVKDNVRAFHWKGTGQKTLLLLDQLKLPLEEKWIRCRTHRDVAECIKKMNVRGAPAIGCVAAYGLTLASFEKKFTSLNKLLSYLKSASTALASTRPTAINLFWALEQMMTSVNPILSDGSNDKSKISQVQKTLESTAVRIFEEDLAANYRIGRLGADLFPSQSVVLTHCNAGSLATSGWGTSLGVIRTAYQEGKVKKVLVDETRPYLQGSRLTAWELKKDKIPFELITDSMAAHFMKTEKVDVVIVGSDRIAANGDVANKIGTYGLAVLSQHHGIPFYVAAPTSTIDLKIQGGDQIPIEQRSAREVTHIKNLSIAPLGVVARHPAFDVTPHHMVSAIITENGLARPPSTETVRSLFDSQTGQLPAEQSI